MNVIDKVIDKAQASIPLHLQIRGAHLYSRAKRAAFKSARPPVFTESPIPDVADVPLSEIDMSNPFMYRQGRWQSYFKRLRDEAPVHFQAKSAFGPFWSITRYEDILYVDKNHHLFSAEPYIVIGAPPEGLDVEMFIAMDPPKHDVQRQAVQGVVAPKNLKEMEQLIRVRVQEVLDSLPVGEPFDWVDKVSIELTSRMLATLLDFPYGQRRRLAELSDFAAGSSGATGGASDLDDVFEAALELSQVFIKLWREKAARISAGEAPGYDLISLMQSHESTKDLVDRPMEFIGNLALLVVGGNDTTRNSMTGGVLALSQFPDEFAKLKANPGLIPTMVSEIIRWQTPLAYM
ncbi:MAG: cytochrome P450, partial [[Mycobacterium] stephanolepidis]